MFKYDSPLFYGIRKLVDLLIADLLWLVFCLPVFTIGASTAAFYATVEKNLKDDRGYAGRLFLDSFKENFKTATKTWLVLLGASLVCFADIAAIQVLGEKREGFDAFAVPFYILLVLLFVYAIWVFALEARFENTWKATMKNALILAVANLPASAAILIFFAAAAFIIWLIPVTVILMPAVAMWFSSVLIEKAFGKNLERNGS